MKPDPYGLLMMAEELHANPADCLYVGDQDVDIDAAKNAGMVSCLVPRKDTATEAAERADIVLHNIDDVLRFI